MTTNSYLDPEEFKLNTLLSLANAAAADTKTKAAVAATKTINTRLNREIKLCIRLDTPDTGNRGLGRFHQIVELFFDAGNRMFVRYKTRNKEEGVTAYEYAVIGRVLLNGDKEDEEAV